MKKVYFGDRYIVIGGGGDKAPSHHSCCYDSINDLKEFVVSFVDDQKAEVCHINGDEETIWREFKALFRNIDAAGGLIKNANGDYLVIDRRGYIDLPKGKKESGESNEQNALREVGEETGIVGARITSHLVDTYHTYMIGEERVLKSTHWYNMEVDGSPELVPQAEEDIVVATWVSKEELRALATKTYASLREVFLSAVAE